MGSYVSRKSSPSHTALIVLLALVALFATAAAACGGGDTKVEPEPDPDPGANAAPGNVEDPPAGATQVDVQLLEFKVVPDPESVPAGTIYFLAGNNGGEAHELVIVRSDSAPGDLPVGDDGRIPEDDIDLVDEIEPFSAGSQASIALDLEPGAYILLCNIADDEGGEIESHYQEGMFAAFTVE